MPDELNRSTIEEHANLTWPKRMERYNGYCVRDGHPGDATSAQEYMTDEEDNFDIIHFIDEGTYHVVCVDGSPVGDDVKTLAEAQAIAQADYSEVRKAIYGL